MTKKALITGITGQDGAYLSEFLVKKGYKVFGAVRRTSSINTSRLSYLGILNDVEIVPMDLAEITNIQRLVEKIEPSQFIEKFGASVDKLDELVKAKTVTVSKLIQILLG